ncbi:rab-GTPase-TBC domain-containing protein [Phlyctochytrium arcticum]|nr:rab-GTPase-TBC domain-containing protein [Phlyctochytrium arcticum]
MAATTKGEQEADEPVKSPASALSSVPLSPEEDDRFAGSALVQPPSDSGDDSKDLTASGFIVVEAPKNMGPVIKPRTSSLKTTAAATASTRSVSPDAGSWTAFIKNRTGLFGAVSTPNGSRGGGSDWEGEEDEYPLSANGPTTFLSSDLDDKSVQYLLSRLEIENQALALNPKTIYVDQGNICGYQPTLQALTTTFTGGSNDQCQPDQADIDFWNSILVQEDPAALQKIPHLLTARVRAGIPADMRSRIWQVLAGAQTDRFSHVYPVLLQQESPYERIIRRDIPRTFPRVEMFREEGGEGQAKLFRVLKAYSTYDSDVGYCQGLSFVVGPLLMQNMSEIEAFAVLVRLLEEKSVQHQHNRVYALRTLFSPNMEGLHQLLFQHSELVRDHLPQLFAHFQAHGITATMYASQWFLTLFTYHFPLPLVFRLFDILFAEGARTTLLAVSLAILKRNEARLLQEEEFEGILEVLKGDRLLEAYEVGATEAVVRDAMAVHDLVSEQRLIELEQRWTDDQRKRAVSISEAELSALQALIRQLRAETSRNQHALDQSAREIQRLRKVNRELEEKLSLVSSASDPTSIPTGVPTQTSTAVDAPRDKSSPTLPNAENASRSEIAVSSVVLEEPPAQGTIRLSDLDAQSSQDSKPILADTTSLPPLPPSPTDDQFV